jgi:hypothetical protein
VHCSAAFLHASGGRCDPLQTCEPTAVQSALPEQLLLERFACRSSDPNLQSGPILSAQCTGGNSPIYAPWPRESMDGRRGNLGTQSGPEHPAQPFEEDQEARQKLAIPCACGCDSRKLPRVLRILARAQKVIPHRPSPQPEGCRPGRTCTLAHAALSAIAAVTRENPPRALPSPNTPPRAGKTPETR